MQPTDPTLGAQALLLAGDPPARPVDSALQRGATLGRYLVLAPLGAGGMGVVYAAYDPELDRKVAIKLWHAQTGQATSADLARGRLQREAQALARLAHPNVVAVFDVGTLEGRLFVAMEHIDGWTLGDWLTHEPRTLPQILEVFLAAGRGLVAAHAAGLVHRDIKPDNLMIGRDGRVRVMDFGLARTDGTPDLRASADEPRGTSALSLDLTRTGGLLGTPAYMAPEQFHGRVSDARGDQFSFCVSLHEAIYGERPFAGSTLGELAQNVITGNIGPARPGSAVPPRVRRILLRGLRPAPEDRYPTMSDLLAALAHDPGVRRRRWLLGGALALALAGGVGLAVLGESPRCVGAETRWAAVWDDTRAAAITQALAATGRPHAADTAARVGQQLAVHGDAWITMQHDACLANQVRGEQSDTLFDLRMRCLADRLHEVDALARQLTTADDVAADRAVQAASGLTPVAVCADAEALAAAVPPPTDPEKRAAVDALQLRLHEVESMFHLGLYHAGRTASAAVLADSRATGHGPLISQAARLTAEFSAQDGDPAAGETLLFTAIDAAAGARDLEGHALAWVALTRLAAAGLHRPEDALRWSRAMTAAVQLLPASAALLASAHRARADALADSPEPALAIPVYEEARRLLIAAHGPDDARLADLDRALGVLLRLLDRHDGARLVFDRALAVGTRTLGEHHPSIAGHLTNLANLDTDAGDFPAARRRMTQALELRLATLGEDHFLVAQTRYNLANIDRLQGDMVAARRGGEAALATFERALGPGHADVAFALNFLGALAHFELRLADAEALFTRALTISEVALGHEHLDLASPLINLGRVALDRGQPEPARTHFARVLAIYEKAFGREHKDLVDPLNGLARAALARGLPEEALASAERALPLVADRDELPAQRAEARALIALALRALGRDRPRARALAEAARPEAPAGPEGDAFRAELDALLARL